MSNKCLYSDTVHRTRLGQARFLEISHWCGGISAKEFLPWLLSKNMKITPENVKCFVLVMSPMITTGSGQLLKEESEEEEIAENNWHTSPLLFPLERGKGRQSYWLPLSPHSWGGGVPYQQGGCQSDSGGGWTAGRVPKPVSLSASVLLSDCLMSEHTKLLL